MLYWYVNGTQVGWGTEAWTNGNGNVNAAGQTLNLQFWRRRADGLAVGYRDADGGRAAGRERGAAPIFSYYEPSTTGNDR